jgi:hypothetical protein
MLVSMCVALDIPIKPASSGPPPPDRGGPVDPGCALEPRFAELLEMLMSYVMPCWVYVQPRFVNLLFLLCACVIPMQEPAEQLGGLKLLSQWAGASSDDAATRLVLGGLCKCSAILTASLV